MAAVLAGGCREEPRPPFARAFSIQVHSPRLLRAGEEIVVPVVTTNTGSESWNPDRVHVSYHWLWIIPRELASRSRNVPYQDGIRTDLERPVASGASVSLDGRVLAPDWPGIRLQWDAVGGRAWFSRVSIGSAHASWYCHRVHCLCSLPLLIARRHLRDRAYRQRRLVDRWRDLQ